MAIAHIQIESVSRATGGTAVNVVAYALGQGKHVKKAPDILARGHIGPVVDWAAVDAREDRSTRHATAKVARTGDYAFPCELPLAVSIEVFREHLTAICERHQLACTFGVHDAPAGGDKRNIHGHPVFTTRRVAANGTLGAKARELDDRKTSSGHIEAWRVDWQQRVNAALLAHGHTARIDMRSYERQGVALTPTRHLGPQISARVKKGYPSERKNRNDAILHARSTRAAADRAERELGTLVRQRAHRAVVRAGGAVDASQRGTAVATRCRAGRRSHAAPALRHGPQTLHPVSQEHQRDVPAPGAENEHPDTRGNRPVLRPGGQSQSDGVPASQGGADRVAAGRSRVGKSPPTTGSKMSDKDRDLLARAKVEIDLPGWFAVQGWTADSEKDSTRHRVMRGPDGERVVIARQSDGHWTFFSATDDRRSGTIYDAVGIYGGAVSPGQQYAALRRALMAPPAPVPVVYAAKTTDNAAAGSTSRPAARVLPLDSEGAAYLMSRHLSETTIEAFRHALSTVQGRGVRARHNRVGGEERGPDWRSFSGGAADDGPGRGRSLWLAAPKSNEPPERIILAESFVDALSAWQMLPREQQASTALASTGGALCEGNLAKLSRLLARLPGVKVLDCTDQGERTTAKRVEQIRGAVESAGCPYRRLEPPGQAKDWNDAVQALAVASAAALLPADEDEQVLKL